MAGRSNELNTETPKVPADGAEHIGVRLAGIATASAHLAQPQRTAKELAELVIQSSAETNLFLSRFSQYQLVAPTGCHPMVTGLCYGTLRTSFDAGSTKDATAKIKRDRSSNRTCNRMGRAHGHTGITTIGTL
jgi:hypothetical protein